MIKKALLFFKTLGQLLLVIGAGFGISLGVLQSVEESTRSPTVGELQSLDSVSKTLPQNHYNVVLRSRKSVLLVMSGKAQSSGFSTMSGTYLTYKNKYYVLTAAHGIMGECEHFFVATDEDDVYECIKYIEIERDRDYAIVEIEEVREREAVTLPTTIPHNFQWKSELATLNKVFYTGYPNSIGPLTFEGSVAGVSDEQYVYLHSYAWPGSSGAGVFSQEGNLIGIILALNVGFTAAGYDVLEDLVIIMPLFKVDWAFVYETMEEPTAAADTGDTGE